MTSPDLAALIALQDLDTAADQARHRLAHLPEKQAADQLRAERTSLAARSQGAAAARDEVAARQAALEAQLEAAEQRRAAVSARMYSGEVSASRDLQAMSAEIDTLAARASTLEDEVLAVLEEREPLDAALDALAVEDAALAEREALALAALSEAERVTAEQLAALAPQRAAAESAVPSELLATYERLRKRLGGIGAARLVGDHCSGCHLALPATELDRIRHSEAGTIAFCDQCGRILVPA